ncbi:queuosine salvage protein-like [Phoenix dactylifera]|uniref:Queuosine 5'-phosphate N-glycosylase/hydrolase n=1 Tax=Phoenix dactylifera TaxID=42345 RepID=A0A8B7BX52_PHODC|nr:queuosine salvage protein-like [Phoenix dactylifera]
MRAFRSFQFPPRPARGPRSCSKRETPRTDKVLSFASPWKNENERTREKERDRERERRAKGAEKGGIFVLETEQGKRRRRAMEDVGGTAAWVASRASHVKVDSSELERVVNNIQGSIPKVEWNFEGIHYFDNGPLTVQYLFVLDALNFCFWPDKDLNYDHLASGLKAALQKDKSALDADRLQNYTGPQLREFLKWPRPLPLEDERVRLLHEVGLELERSFGGQAANLVKSCGNSAITLVALVTRHFPGFRDHSLYKGHQVFLYKRAQIFAADLWGAFKGQSFGNFYDIGSITIFADYIVPAVLRQLGVLKYSSALSSSIDSNDEIGAGSEEEVEIRACSIHAVEKMRELIESKFRKQVLSVEMDLWLWSYGVQKPSLRHHRTLSIYY